jgi:uncharacterized membrane protein YraQ (UPF0718 family)
VFGIGIGLIMAYIYRRDDQSHNREMAGNAFAATARVRMVIIVFMLLLLAALIVGTLGVDLFTDTYGQFTVPIQGTPGWQATLDRLIPYDASQGQEGVSVHGVLLITLLALIGGTAYLGLNKIDEGFNGWSWAALGLIAATLLLAALRVTPQPAGLTIGLTGRFFGEVLVLSAIGLVAWHWLDTYDVQEWLWEMWRFVKQIFPLLIVGVFIAGMVRVLIPPSLIEAIAGRNTVWANLIGVLFGVFMYFPTLVEVPIANMFMGLGMHRGPLLAYLMADPELSVQSILITAKVIGKNKAWTYVIWVTLFSTLAGLIYGAWVDGTSLWLVGLYLVGVAGLLGAGLFILRRLDRRSEATAEGQV